MLRDVAAVVVVVGGVSGTLAWWRWRRQVERDNANVVRLLTAILDQLRRRNGGT